MLIQIMKSKWTHEALCKLLCLPDSYRLLWEVCFEQGYFQLSTWGKTLYQQQEKKKKKKKILSQYNLVLPCDAVIKFPKFPELSRCLGSDCSHPFHVTIHNYKSKISNSSQGNKSAGRQVWRWMNNGWNLCQTWFTVGKLSSPSGWDWSLSEVCTHRSPRPEHPALHTLATPCTSAHLLLHLAKERDFTHSLPEFLLSREAENQQNDDINSSRTNSLLVA